MVSVDMRTRFDADVVLIHPAGMSARSHPVRRS